MNKVNAKQRCPKCGGNLFLCNDYSGWYEQCLQCSFTHYLDVLYEKEETDSGKGKQRTKATEAKK